MFAKTFDLYHCVTHQMDLFGVMSPKYVYPVVKASGGPRDLGACETSGA
jgi:hypothetical protein